MYTPSDLGFYWERQRATCPGGPTWAAWGTCTAAGYIQARYVDWLPFGLAPVLVLLLPSLPVLVGVLLVLALALLVVPLLLAATVVLGTAGGTYECVGAGGLGLGACVGGTYAGARCVVGAGGGGSTAPSVGIVMVPPAVADAACVGSGTGGGLDVRPAFVYRTTAADAAVTTRPTAANTQTDRGMGRRFGLTFTGRRRAGCCSDAGMRGMDGTVRYSLSHSS